MRILQYAAKAALAILIGSCTGQAAKAPDNTVVSYTRSFERTLHADADFSPAGKAIVLESAQKWREASQGRVNIQVEFDLDIEDIEGIRAHLAAKHSMLRVIDSNSRMANWIDAVLAKPNRKPVAFTTVAKDGSAYVYLIEDRFQAGQALEVVMHELGHVMGLPDLEDFGSVMSGAHYATDKGLTELTEGDLNACRAAHYCQ